MAPTEPSDPIAAIRLLTVVAGYRRRASVKARDGGRVVQLAADEHGAVQARRFARTWSTGQALSPRLVDDIELVVAELVSNAIRHASPPYEVELSESDGVIHGEVHDGSPVAPTVNVHPDHHGGFGLGIVSACTTRWGTALVPEGKRVWFEVPRS